MWALYLLLFSLKLKLDSHTRMLAMSINSYTYRIRCFNRQNWVDIRRVRVFMSCAVFIPCRRCLFFLCFEFGIRKHCRNKQRIQPRFCIFLCVYRIEATSASLDSAICRLCTTFYVACFDSIGNNLFVPMLSDHILWCNIQNLEGNTGFETFSFPVPLCVCHGSTLNIHELETLSWDSTGIPYVWLFSHSECAATESHLNNSS